MSALRKLQAIKNLEISSVCNLACPYCPARLQDQHRDVGLMDDATFDRALYWLDRWVRAGTQRELNLFGVGEPLLHPKVVEFARRCREVMPLYLRLLMNTNGILLTEDVARALYDAGVDKIDITDHDAEVSMRAIRVLRKVTGQYRDSQDPRSRWGYSRDGVVNPNNWGGLIDWVPSVEHPRVLCPWLAQGQVMVMSNGDVTRCCQDAFGRGILGTVHDDLDRIDHSPYVQCETCHEEVPAGMPRVKTERKEGVA